MPSAAETLIPMPLPEAWVIAGAPSPQGRVLVSSPDGRQVAGTWECGAGTFRYHHRAAETIRIELGMVELTVGDESRTLTAGDMAHFPAGTESIWHIARFARKTFFLLKPDPGIASQSPTQAKG